VSEAEQRDDSDDGCVRVPIVCIYVCVHDFDSDQSSMRTIDTRYLMLPLLLTTSCWMCGRGCMLIE
jgi:hypothetical protein